MTEKILAFLANFIIATISASGYVGIALLMAIESAGIPLPSEIIMPFAGYLVHIGQLTLLGVATAGAIGCNLGSALAYWIGAWGGRPLILSMAASSCLTIATSTAPKNSLHITGRLRLCRPSVAGHPHFHRDTRWHRSHEPARFHIYTFLGSWPWCLALAYAGMKLGQAWDTNPVFKNAFHRFHTVVVVLLLTAIVWFVWTHWKDRVRPSEA